MKLKPKKKLSIPEEKVEEKKPRGKSKPNDLPPDTYTPLFEPIRILIRETLDKNMKPIRNYVEFSVKRYGGDDENAPEVYMQMYQESEFYTGYRKGRCVHFPLEELYDVIDSLSDLSEKCDEKGII